MFSIFHSFTGKYFLPFPETCAIWPGFAELSLPMSSTMETQMRGLTTPSTMATDRSQPSLAEQGQLKLSNFTKITNKEGSSGLFHKLFYLSISWKEHLQKVTNQKVIVKKYPQKWTWIYFYCLYSKYFLINEYAFKYILMSLLRKSCFSDWRRWGRGPFQIKLSNYRHSLKEKKK